MPYEPVDLEPLYVSILPEYTARDIAIIERLIALEQSNLNRSSFRLVDTFKAAISSTFIYFDNEERNEGFIPQAALGFRQLINTLFLIITEKESRLTICHDLMDYIIQQWKCKKSSSTPGEFTLRPKEIEQLDRKFNDYTKNYPNRVDRVKEALNKCIDTTSLSASNRELLLEDHAKKIVEVLVYINGYIHHKPKSKIKRFFDYYEKCMEILWMLLKFSPYVRLPSEELPE